MGMLKHLEKVVTEFLAAATEGPLVREVATLRASGEAVKARDARTKATTVWSLAEDPEVRLAQRVSDEIAGQLQAARAHRATLEPSPGVMSSHPDLSPARALVQDCEAALKEARAWCTAAESATREWIHMKRREGVQAIDAKLRAAVEPAYALAVEREQYAEETKELAELRDPDDPGHPFSRLLGLGAAIEQPGTWWELRTPPDPPTPRGRPGEMRVRFTAVVPDHHNLRVQFPGDLGHLPADVARDLVKRRLAEPVKAS